LKKNMKTKEKTEKEKEKEIRKRRKGRGRRFSPEAKASPARYPPNRIDTLHRSAATDGWTPPVSHLPPRAGDRPEYGVARDHPILT
jgi:hypothetical protein